MSNLVAQLDTRKADRLSLFVRIDQSYPQMYECITEKVLAGDERSGRLKTLDYVENVAIEDEDGYFALTEEVYLWSEIEEVTERLFNQIKQEVLDISYLNLDCLT